MKHKQTKNNKQKQPSILSDVLYTLSMNLDLMVNLLLVYDVKSHAWRDGEPNRQTKVERCLEKVISNCALFLSCKFG